MNEALRIVLPIYLITFFGVAFAWRSYLVWKRTGINPYVVGRTGKPIDFIENLYPVPTVLLLAATIVFVFVPRIYEYLVPIPWLDLSSVKVLGLFFMGFGLIWTAVAQMQMGASWRIGIDLANKTELVERGLFGLSRNPIFLGMRFALFGFFLAMPNAITLCSIVLLDVLMQIQVRLEEEFPTNAHCEEYVAFCGRVRRWI